MINSQAKGKNFEREFAKQLNKDFDANVRRTPCSGALSFKGDILDTQGVLSHWHFECKNQEKLNVWKSMQQAKRDCQVQKRWLLVFTRNFDDTYIAMEYETWKNLVIEIEELKDESDGWENAHAEVVKELSAAEKDRNLWHKGYWEMEAQLKEVWSSNKELVESLIPFSQMHSSDDFDIMWCQKAKTAVANYQNKDKDEIE